LSATSQASRRDAEADEEAFSPWNDTAIGFPAMAGKTAKRRLSRSLPLSAYIAAARIDEAFEEQGKPAFLHPEKGVVIDGEVAPLADSQPANPQGPSLTEVTEPGFLIQGREQTLRLPTIEQWRARMVDQVERMTPEAAAKFYDLNVVYLDDYGREHPREVAAVVAAFDKKRE
jgi:hypothetical protein